MRDLQRYMDSSRQSSTTEWSQDSPVQYSIVELSKQFAADMIFLHELLPYDMSTFSTSLRKRAKFVLKEKDTAKILARLEGRKSAATLALQLVGRYVWR